MLLEDLRIPETRRFEPLFLKIPNGDHDQAADRIHRIGQTKSVKVYYGVCTGTIDDLQYCLLEESRKVVADVVDGSSD